MAASGTYNDSPALGFDQADTTITATALLVILTGDHTVTLAGLTDNPIGVSYLCDALGGFGTAGDGLSVLMLKQGARRPFTAAGAITQGAYFYSAASGKVSATPSGAPLGIAEEAASGSGSIFTGLCLDRPGIAGAPAKIVTVKTASYQVLQADLGTILVANHASVEVDFTLPAAAAANVGAEIIFVNEGAAIMGILPKNAGEILTNGAASSAASCKFSTSSHIIGAKARAIQITSTQWYVFNESDCTMTIA